MYRSDECDNLNTMTSITVLIQRNYTRELKMKHQKKKYSTFVTTF